MRRTRLRFFCQLTIAVLFSLSLAQIASAQTDKEPDDKETLRALLIEVRTLREALQTLQRMSIDTYRTQGLIDRIRVEREDVRRLTASLNETRDQLVRTQATIPQFIDRQKLFEAQLQLEVDQGKRAELEFELKRTKEGIETYKAQIEPLKEREQQTAADLNKQKAQLEELEGRLDLLERGIENDRQKLSNERPAAAKSP